MRISEMLNAIASWLENPDNEAILLAEYNDKCLNIVVNSCIQAASLLKTAANEVDGIEPPPESNLTPESLDGLCNIADAFDASNDADLKKQASVIDELLLSIAAPKDFAAIHKSLQDSRIEELKKKYHHQKNDKIADMKDDAKKSKLMKEVNINDHSLNTRYCPDHAGVSLYRVGENEWQCELDKKIYNFESGYTLNDGKVVPGGSVANQTNNVGKQFHSIFDTREDRIGSSK